MIKEITTVCPFCGKQHEYKMACPTAEQAERWEKTMTAFAEAFCACDTAPLPTTFPASREQWAAKRGEVREQMAQKYNAVHFREQTKLYTVKCAYTKIRYDFTLPNAKGNYLTVRFMFDFCEDGQTNLVCSAVATDENYGLVKFDVPDGWEYDADDYSYIREITDFYLSRQNLDRIATECYRKFMQTR